MKQYLLMSRHTLDDLPLGLYGSIQKAEGALEGERLSHCRRKCVEKILGLTASDSPAYSIVEFTDGNPTDVICYKS